MKTDEAHTDREAKKRETVDCEKTVDCKPVDRKSMKASEGQGRDVSHLRVVGPLLVMLGVMSGVVLYSPELYNMFCAATGYGGTTQRAEVNSGQILDQEILVRFDGLAAKELNWMFKPVTRSMSVRIGETVVAKYKAKNLAQRPVVGSAVYNVTPEIAGSYFNKIECFCFTEQLLEPGEEIEMPVSFYVDPEIVKDKSGRRVKEITLSYVFYEKKQPVKAAFNLR